MAHIQKRGPGRWRARYRGPDRKEHSKTFSKRSDAERWLNTVEVAKDQGTWADPALGRVLLSDYARVWLSTKPRSTDDGVDAVAVGGLGRRAAAVIVVTSMRAA